METFSALLAICAGNSPVPGDFPRTQASDAEPPFSLIYARINGWVNTGEAGDLIRHHAHYDVIVMTISNVYVFVNYVPFSVYFNFETAS